MDLIDVDWGALGRRMSRVVQGHVDAGLGSDARVLGVRMEEDRVIITVSRSPQDSSTSQEESTPKSRRRG